jgi:ACT domain-containing protein
MANIELESSAVYTFHLDMEELNDLIKDLQELQAQMKLTRTDCLLSTFVLNRETDLVLRVTK